MPIEARIDGGYGERHGEWLDEKVGIRKEEDNLPPESLFWALMPTKQQTATTTKKRTMLAKCSDGTTCVLRIEVGVR